MLMFDSGSRVPRHSLYWNCCTIKLQAHKISQIVALHWLSDILVQVQWEPAPIICQLWHQTCVGFTITLYCSCSYFDFQSSSSIIITASNLLIPDWTSFCFRSHHFSRSYDWWRMKTLIPLQSSSATVQICSCLVLTYQLQLRKGRTVATLIL